jgi:hypothetical protein
VTAGGIMVMTVLCKVTVGTGDLTSPLTVLTPIGTIIQGPNKLTTHEPYTRSDNVRTAEGTGMSINHVGHSILCTPHNSFHLNAILHVPNASKNLLSVHRFTLDNHVFIEFHPFSF